MDNSWIRPALIVGAVIILIGINAFEFRGKRRKDAETLDAMPDPGERTAWLARQQYEQTRNIEQVLHIMNTVLIATLVAVLTL